MKKLINPCHPRNPRSDLDSSPMRQQNPDGQRDTEHASHDELPGPLHRDGPEHANAKAREHEIDRALNHQAPADESDDDPRKSMPNGVERDDESAQREMDESIQEAAHFALLAEHNEELDPD